VAPWRPGLNTMAAFQTLLGTADAFSERPESASSPLTFTSSMEPLLTEQKGRDRLV